MAKFVEIFRLFYIPSKRTDSILNLFIRYFRLLALEKKTTTKNETHKNEYDTEKQWRKGIEISQKQKYVFIVISCITAIRFNKFCWWFRNFWEKMFMIYVSFDWLCFECYAEWKWSKLHAISRLTDLLIKELGKKPACAGINWMEQVQTTTVKNEQMLNGRLIST